MVIHKLVYKAKKLKTLLEQYNYHIMGNFWMTKTNACQAFSKILGKNTVYKNIFENNPVIL